MLSIFVMPCFAREVAYKVWWYSLGSEQVLFAMAGSVVVACALELASDIRKLLSSTRERLCAYDALLGSSRSVLLLVVAFMMTSPPAIDRCLNFLKNLNYTCNINGFL